jgi:signal transduction histidine kinase
MTWFRTRRSRDEKRVPARGVAVVADPPQPPGPSAADPAETPRGLAALGASATAGAYLLPPALAAALACLVAVSGAGPFETTTANLALAGGILLVGLAAGAWAGGAAAAERRALAREYEERLDDLDHDLRGPLTIIRGEVELVLSREDIPIAERGRSTAAIIGQLERLELRLRQRYRP